MHEETDIKLRGNSLNSFGSLQISSVEEEEQEDDYEEEEEKQGPVTLGFVEKPKTAHSLLCQLFPSKAGGVPAWLDPIDLPSEKLRICDICGEPLQFVLQLHSVVGVELGKETRSVAVAEEHAIAQRSIRHKVECQRMSISSQSSDSSPCDSKTASLEIEKGASEGNDHSTSLVSYQMDEALKSMMDNFEGDDDKKSWASFQEQIAKALQQVLRYCRDVKAKPLWPMSSGRPYKVDIPNCSYCGGPLYFEFQILPQLLYYFGVKNDADSLDWATIAVFTPEFAWVQLSSPSAVIP